MRAAVRWIAGVALIVLASAVPARAQATNPATTGRFEVGVAAGWWSGYDLGTASTARFDAEAAIDGGPALAGRFGWRVWRTLTLEAAATTTRASLQSTIRSTVDPALNGATDTRFHQLAAELGVKAPVGRTFRNGRLAPFVTGGGGYLRQTYEDGVLLETGRLFYIGGGLRYGPAASRPDRFFKYLGVRLDARAVVRTGGIDVDETARVFPVVTVGAFIVF
jgi:hypothetical protein